MKYSMEDFLIVNTYKISRTPCRLGLVLRSSLHKLILETKYLLGLAKFYFLYQQTGAAAVNLHFSSSLLTNEGDFLGLRRDVHW